VEDLADTRTIRPVGELDTVTAPELLKALRHALIRRPTILAADLSDVEFLGVAGLEVLLRMRRVAGRGGTAFVLTGDPRPQVTRLLGIVGLGVTTLPRRICGASASGRPATRAAGGRVRLSHGPRESAPMRAVPS
jgi:anti-anti-sigma factor